MIPGTADSLLCGPCQTAQGSEDGIGASSNPLESTETTYLYGMPYSLLFCCRLHISGWVLTKLTAK